MFICSSNQISCNTCIQNHISLIGHYVYVIVPAHEIASVPPRNDYLFFTPVFLQGVCHSLLVIASTPPAGVAISEFASAPPRNDILFIATVLLLMLMQMHFLSLQLQSLRATIENRGVAIRQSRCELKRSNLIIQVFPSWIHALY